MYHIDNIHFFNIFTKVFSSHSDKYIINNKGVRKMKNRDFGNKTTFSKGKQSTEVYFDILFLPYITEYLKKHPNAVAHILVGSTYGLDRHVRRLRALGFKDSQIIIHEIVDAQADRLRQSCKRKGYKCKVLSGDMLKNVEFLVKKGVKTAYIEFDGTKPYGTFEFDLFKFTKKHDIPCLLVEGATRGHSEAYNKACKALGHRMERDKYQGNLRYPIHKYAKLLGKNKMKGYNNQFITYKGVSGMYAQAFIKAA